MSKQGARRTSRSRMAPGDRPAEGGFTRPASDAKAKRDFWESLRGIAVDFAGLPFVVSHTNAGRQRVTLELDQNELRRLHEKHLEDQKGEMEKSDDGEEKTKEKDDLNPKNPKEKGPAQKAS